MVLFKMSRLPEALEILFRFRVAIIAITPDNAFLLHTPLQDKISNSLRYVSKDLKFSIL